MPVVFPQYPNYIPKAAFPVSSKTCFPPSFHTSLVNKEFANWKITTLMAKLTINRQFSTANCKRLPEGNPHEYYSIVLFPINPKFTKQPSHFPLFLG